MGDKHPLKKDVTLSGGEVRTCAHSAPPPDLMTPHPPGRGQPWTGPYLRENQRRDMGPQRSGREVPAAAGWQPSSSRSSMDPPLGHFLGWPCPLSPHTLEATASSHSEHLMPGGSLRWGMLRPAPWHQAQAWLMSRRGRVLSWCLQVWMTSWRAWNPTQAGVLR